MPLHSSTGIPIRAPRKRAPAARPAAAAAAPLPPMLSVPYVRQEQDQWCWAACAQMVATFLGNTTVKQCELANFLHGQTNCCQQPGSLACNQPAPYAGIGQVYAELNVACISEPRPENAQVILRELSAGRPVEIGFLWFGGGGHVVVIRGVTAQGLFAVHDPWFGSG